MRLVRAGCSLGTLVPRGGRRLGFLGPPGSPSTAVSTTNTNTTTTTKSPHYGCSSTRDGYPGRSPCEPSPLFGVRIHRTGSCSACRRGIAAGLHCRNVLSLAYRRSAQRQRSGCLQAWRWNDFHRMACSRPPGRNNLQLPTSDRQTDRKTKHLTCTS
ncbi:hypothetical protein VTO42DRAFT_2735 [Malbranchea cinnamomea]